jgi:tetratricopeptide (TPR) repeat protein
MRGYLTEGRGWLDRALATAGGLVPPLRARALGGAGVLAESQGDYEQATVLHEAALAAACELGDQIGVANALTDLGSIARFQGEHGRAAELQNSLWRDLNDERGMSSSLHELGWSALDSGDYPAAKAHLTQCLELVRHLGEPAALGAVLEKLGMLSFYRGEYEQAVGHYQESLEIWQELQDTRLIAYSLANLGEARQRQGDLTRTESMYQESLSLFRDLGLRSLSTRESGTGP